MEAQETGEIDTPLSNRIVRDSLRTSFTWRSDPLPGAGSVILLQVEEYFKIYLTYIFFHFERPKHLRIWQAG